MNRIPASQLSWLFFIFSHLGGCGYILNSVQKRTISSEQISFDILGASGGSDTLEDEYLKHDTLKATWTAVPSAEGYLVRVLNETGSAEVCPSKSVNVPEATFTGCSLTHGLSYTIEAHALEGGANIAAKNSPYKFTVVSIPLQFLKSTWQVTSNSKPFSISALHKGGLGDYLYSIFSGQGSITAPSLFAAPDARGSTQIRVDDKLNAFAQAQVDSRPYLTNGGIYKSIVHNGSLYIAGSFSAVYPTYTPNLAVLNLTTGDLDPQNLFNYVTNGFDSFVSSMVLDGDYLYLSGSFTSYRGTPAHRIARVNVLTAELDTTFTQATGFNDHVGKFVLSDGSIYAIGSFTTYRGFPANQVAKISATDGTLDTIFTQATGLNGQALSVLKIGSSIYVGGGGFSTYRGTAVQGLVKIDSTNGNLDTSFTQATGFSGAPYFLLEHGGSLYVAGSFSSYRGTTVQNIAKLHPTSGVLDTTFSQTTGFSGTSNTLLADGSHLYVGGGFTSYRGTNAMFIARIHATTGVLDTTFTQAQGFSGGVYTIKKVDDQLYVGGQFYFYRNTPAYGIAKISAVDGALDTTFTQSSGIGQSGSTSVRDLVVLGQNIWVGGYFDTYRGVPAENLAKIDLATGAVDTTFTQATGFDSNVNDIAISGSSIYVGGDFFSYRGVLAERMAKLDLTTGVLDTVFTQTTGFSSTVRSIAVAGSYLFVGGWFPTYRSTSARGIAKIHATTGALDTTFTQATGFSNGPFVRRINTVLVAGTSVYVGGEFTSYRGTTVQNIAKLDQTSGALDTTFTQTTGANSEVTILATDGTSLFGGGYFSTYRGGTALGLMKLHLATGVRDTTFTQATGADGSIDGLAFLGSDLFISGGFTTYRGVASRGLAKISKTNGNLDGTFSVGTGFSLGAGHLELVGNLLYIASYSESYQGTWSPNFAIVNSTTGALAY